MNSFSSVRSVRSLFLPAILLSAGLALSSARAQSEGAKPPGDQPKPAERQMQRDRAEIMETIEKMRNEISTLRQSMQRDRAERPAQPGAGPAERPMGPAQAGARPVERPAAREGMMPSPQGPRQPMAPLGEPERRLRNLNMGIENLRAAGFPEMADQIVNRMEQLKRQIEERRGNNAPQPNFGEGNRRPMMQQRPFVPRSRIGNEPLNQGVRQLQAEINDLRQTIQDLRAKVQQLTEQRR
jgi:hypothetical protein